MKKRGPGDCRGLGEGTGGWAWQQRGERDGRASCGVLKGAGQAEQGTRDAPGRRSPRGAARGRARVDDVGLGAALDAVSGQEVLPPFGFGVGASVRLGASRGFLLEGAGGRGRGESRTGQARSGGRRTERSMTQMQGWGLKRPLGSTERTHDVRMLFKHTTKEYSVLSIST